MTGGVGSLFGFNRLSLRVCDVIARTYFLSPSPIASVQRAPGECVACFIALATHETLCSAIDPSKPDLQYFDSMHSWLATLRAALIDIDGVVANDVVSQLRQPLPHSASGASWQDGTILRARACCGAGVVMPVPSR